MLPFSSSLSNHIRFLLETANSFNSDSVLRELCQYAEYGCQASIVLLQTCLDQMNYSGENTVLKPKVDLLSAVFKHLLHRPNFTTVFCEAFPTSMKEGFLEYISNMLNLSLSEGVIIGLALSESESVDLKTKGQNFCICQIEELCTNPASLDSNEQILDIYMLLCSSEGFSKYADHFAKILSLIPVKEGSFFSTASAYLDGTSDLNALRQLDLFFESSENDFEMVLAEMEKEMSMANIIMELGYGCTANTSHCKEMLSYFLPLSEAIVARLIGTVTCASAGVEDTQNIHYTYCSAVGSNIPSESSSMGSWNVEVLVDSIGQLAPTINWTNVMLNLDHEGFNIPDVKSFCQLMSVYRKACQDPFPLLTVCGSVWRNTEGQLSFLRHAVSAHPDVFTFAHSSRQLSDLIHFANKDGNQAWSCLDLLEVLCELAERGHGSSVRKLLEQPISQCPEVLLAAISHINTTYNFLQSEVFSVLFPSILRDPMKTGLVHYIWRTNPHLVLRRFLDVYTDMNCLFRILDICQELKILTTVLEATPFHFSIKLASLALRKEHVTLEKWLNENLNAFKDSFFKDCLKFLQELFDMESDVPDNSINQSQTSILSAFQETVSIFLKVLKTHAVQVSHKLSEELDRLSALSSLKNQSSVTNSDGSTDEIEAEANAYFQQMFAGELTIDDMVQMLARFKESSERREQKIYECMVSNLFEEYKFFSKYPDRQLKITAVLFGSLIKHQLVTHLALGIALRGVLDALRKSVDSKMFMFGTTALEQFMDRLVEWPLYCNHILQISHLRNTHSELVSVIERTLARVSSSQVESNGGTNISTEMQQVSTPSSIESMEATESSWQLIGSSSGQLGQQPTSFQQLQPQHRHQGFLGDSLKSVSIPASYSKTFLSNNGQPSVVSLPVESVPNNKISASQPPQPPSSQHLVGVTASVSSSPGFLRASRSTTPSGMLRQSSYSTGFGAALNIETLVAAAEKRDTPIEAPASEVQDKILFIVNNISTSNMEAKAKEFNEVLKEQYYPWFAEYMVMKRASIEPNFHDLYLKFLDRVNSRALNKEIVKATYENCKVLLRSDLIKSSSEERSLLKNLGSWLGKFTIGRNQVLRAKELDPKVLIIEAYEKGLMIAVIPFTSKVLEPCQNSLAYQPPNPWTMGILSLLAEIYNLPSLKMNLKFDIEVLFKNLGVDMKDVKPTSLLRDRVRELEGNPDFSNKDATASQASIMNDVNPVITPSMNQVELQQEVNNASNQAGHQNVLNQYTASIHLASSTMVDDEKIGGLIIPERAAQGLPQIAPSHSPFSLNQLLTIIPNSDSYINVNPKLSSMGSQLQFQRIIQLAMDRAIKDIVSPVIQRSVTIATQTTKELVLKDYAMESDDNIISRAARLMVGTLAGSLAHVTCKELLRVSLSNNLRNLLSGNVNSERVEHVVQILTNDHLDLGCAMIENVASDKAVELIDVEIGPSFAAIRKQRDAAGSAFYDAGAYSQGPFARVPEALRPKPGRLSVSQQRDFIRNIWQNQSSQNTAVAPAGPTALSGNSVNILLPRVHGSASGQLISDNNPSPQVASGFSPAAQPSDTLAEESDRVGLHLSTSDSVAQSTSEINAATALLPTAVACSELQIPEPSLVPKDVGAVVTPTPAPQVTERSSGALVETLLTTGDTLEKYQLLAHKLDTLIAKDAREAEIQGVVSEVRDILLRGVSRDEAALAVAQKVFKSLYENSSNATYVGAHLAILAAIRDVCKLVVKELTSWVIYSDEDRKFNKEITVGLIRSELLNLSEYNMHLAKLIDGGRNKAATDFAISLVQALVLNESGVSVSEFYHLIDALTKLAMRPGSPESLQQLIEIARNHSNSANPLASSTASKDEKVRQSKDKKQVLLSRSAATREETDSTSPDPTGFREQVSLVFAEWCRICDLHAATDSSYALYLSQLQQTGLLKGDDMTDRFFRILMELSVASSLSSEQTSITGSLPIQSTQLQYLSFSHIDAFAKLVVFLMKCTAADQGMAKMILLPKFLSVSVKTIQKDADEKKALFNPRPYFRLFINLLFDLPSLDPAPDGANFQVLTSFASAFHALQPLKVPGFSFAWLELISHRSFMPKLLTVNSLKGWPFFQRLLVDLLKFMEPYLRNADLTEPIQFLYKGMLRVLLVLLHDFPEFLCDYHFSFCDVIPPSCIQMRNVILSAFPRNMRLPDPSIPNLKIDLLAEITQPPRILSDVDGALKLKQLKADIDEYLMTRTEGSTFLTELKHRLQLSPTEAVLAGTRYNVPLINSVVLYVGMQAILQVQSRSNQPSSTQQVSQNPPMETMLVGAATDIFQSLVKSLDTEGRYLFLNAVANQLRYPNNHTHYFSCLLLFLFADKNQEPPVQEQITRVLLERLIVNRPHPWGLLITFIELIKNPRYNFWGQSFTRCAPEIEKLFESVSRTCGGPKTVDDGLVSGGIPDGSH